MSAADRFLFVFVTAFGAGLAPIAPGTFGTLPAVAIAALMQVFWFPARHRRMGWALLGAATVLLVAGCLTTGHVERVFETEDPPAFALDEIVGYFVTLGMFCLLKQPTPRAHVASFFLFRLFDVTKPSPARDVEHWHGAPGIMADDVVAGIYAGLVLFALHSLGVL